MRLSLLQCQQLKKLPFALYYRFTNTSPSPIPDLRVNQTLAELLSMLNESVHLKSPLYYPIK